ncbi:hypothetical protein CONLIGDRAFT_53333 [Coniochaeta ligniaria NRRL 30616]|uniref:PNPLA domain-containing protein n=1 Tax=Coniochaeta ligniaria NRRL 30616 TaxID=1408157 RepID=A0A1J7K0S8_9PEZI|nr:hypothetical protein CONLIGDRAFT_53333 [Coniochaeta ligniaria NRRL 30616]
MSIPDENGPLYLLSLDGGGIRGVSELVMLDCIMRRLQKKKGLDELPKPCDYFDLIAGTSTGGLIAILLGRLRMTTQEALDAYDDVAETLFSRSNRKYLAKSQFKSTTLEDVVKEIVAQRSSSDLLKYQDKDEQKGKAFVCAIDEKELGAIHRLRTYNIDGTSDEGLKDCKVWEAARATTAAPLNFKPMTIQRDSDKTTYIDAALGYNNPVEQLLEEAGNIFHSKRTLGAIVSLGTGTRKLGLASPEDVNGLGYGLSIVATLKNETTDTERPHKRLQAKFKKFPNTYFRFNVPDGADEVKLAEWRKMGELKKLTTDYIGNEAVDQEINDLVEVLSKRKTAGLTLGHICLLDSKQLLMNSHLAQHMGTSSNFFTGRTKVLESLEDRFFLREPGERGRREFLICGMGGAGKTQIALKFVETKAKLLFKRCFWIDATDGATAQEGYQEFASEAFPDKEVTTVSMAAVQKWMADLDEEWLLVLDNSNEENMRQFVPPGNTGNIIYTSRRHNLAASLQPEWVAEVNDMEPEDAITLLLRTAGHIPYNRELRAEASPVVAELGCLPLAIDQAGAYIRRMGGSLSDYLALFKSQRQRLLQDPDFKGLLRDPRFKGTDPRNQAVYATFDISYNALREIAHEHEGSVKGEDARNALKILRLICFYHNDTLVLEMFDRASIWGERVAPKLNYPLGKGKDALDNLIAVRDNVWDSNPVMFGLMVLEDFSLVKWDHYRLHVSMHVLVHDWALTSIGKKDMARLAGYAKAILFGSISYDTHVESYRFHRRIYPHVEACLRRANMSQEDTRAQAGYQMKLGTLYEQSGQFESARDAFHKSIGLWKTERGPDDHLTLRAMSLLASLEKADGKLGEAAFVLLQILELRQMRIDDLSSRQDKRNPEDLKRQARRGVESDDDEQLLKRLRLKSAMDWAQLAVVYMGQSHLDAAEHAMLQTVEIRKAVAPETAAWAERHLTKIRLARAQDATYNLDDSPRADSRRSVEDARASLAEAIEEHGHDHRDTIRALGALAKAEMDAGNGEAAEEIAKEFARRCTEVYGEDGRKTLAAIELYSKVLQHNEQHIDAAGMRTLILTYSQRTLGIYHPDTIEALLKLGVGLGFQGRFEEAVIIATRAVELLEGIHGATHRAVLSFRKTLEIVKSNAARATPNTRRQMARDALRKYHEHGGGDHYVVDDDFVDRWANVVHLSMFWPTGIGEPEEVYFAERPPVVNSVVVAEEEEQQARPTQQELPLDRESLADEFA